jgi:hypothetical protein
MYAILLDGSWCSSISWTSERIQLVFLFVFTEIDYVKYLRLAIYSTIDYVDNIKTNFYLCHSLYRWIRYTQIGAIWLKVYVLTTKWRDYVYFQAKSPIDQPYFLKKVSCLVHGLFRIMPNTRKYALFFIMIWLI